MREVLISKNTMKSWRSCFSCCCVAPARRKAIRTFNGRLRAFLLIFQHRRKQLRQERASTLLANFSRKKQKPRRRFRTRRVGKATNKGNRQRRACHIEMLETRIEKQNFWRPSNRMRRFPDWAAQGEGRLASPRKTEPAPSPAPTPDSRAPAARCFANARPDALKSSAGQKKKGVRGEKQEGRGGGGQETKVFSPRFFPRLDTRQSPSPG